MAARAPVRTPFVTRLLPGSAATARIDVMQPGRAGLLSVREAAGQLGLCTATVYGLCADGAVPHIRILNAIRIAPADLEAFIEARRIGTRRRPSAAPQETSFGGLPVDKLALSSSSTVAGSGGRASG